MNGRVARKLRELAHKYQIDIKVLKKVWKGLPERFRRIETLEETLLFNMAQNEDLEASEAS